MKIEQRKSEFPESYQSLITPIKESINQLCGRTTEIDFDILQDTNPETLLGEEEFPRVLITFGCDTSGEWAHWLVLPPELVVSIYAWMIGDEPGGDLGDEHLEGLQEAINQIFGQLQTFLEVQDINIEFTDLDISRIEDSDQLPEKPEDDVIGVNYQVNIEDNNFSANHYYWMESEPEPAPQPEPKTPEPKTAEPEPQVEVNPAEFEDFESNGNNNNSPRNLDMLMDVKLEAVVELGRKTIPIKDILKLGKGSIIELNKTAGESLDIFINGRKLAEGEVVVVDEQFGIRITHLLEPKERIKSLQ